MTNLITLTIPNDDHIALRAFGKALEEMALAHGAAPRKTTVGEMSYDINAVVSGIKPEITDAYIQGCYDTEARLVETDTTTQQVESLVGKPVLRDDNVIGTVSQVEVKGNAAVATLTLEPTVASLVTGVDSTGTPWDERIHSTSKALNADGTWRLRRKPKDKSDAEWTDYVKWVLDDIHMVQQTADDNDDSWDTDRRPGSGGEGGVGVGESDEPPVTPPGDDFHTDAGVVTEQTVAGIPPLPVPPPVVIAPPVPEVTTWDFPRLMTFLTERHGKIDVATVNTLLAQDGMSSVQELNAHPDKIGPFVARVKAHLGE